MRPSIPGRPGNTKGSSGGPQRLAANRLETPANPRDGSTEIVPEQEGGVREPGMLSDLLATVSGGAPTSA